MPESIDKITRGFHALRSATAAEVSPPGVAAVMRTVRRRRTTRASLCLLVLAVAVPFVWQASRMAAPTTLATPSADPTTSASPTPMPTSTSTVTTEVSPGDTGGRRPTASPASPICDPHVLADAGKMWIVDDAAWNTLECAGKTIGVFWVTYRTVQSYQLKYRSGQYSLGAGNLRSEEHTS